MLIPGLYNTLRLCIKFYNENDATIFEEPVEFRVTEQAPPYRVWACCVDRQNQIQITDEPHRPEAWTVLRDNEEDKPLVVLLLQKLRHLAEKNLLPAPLWN